MDLKEFQQRLGAEPRGQDPEVLTARGESVAHAAAYRAALDFEDRLEAALRVPVPNDAAERIIERCLGRPARPWLPAWVGIAAVLALAIGIGVWLLPIGPNPADLELRTAFVEHLDNPEPALVSDATVGAERVRAAFAVAGAEFDGGLDNVTYLSPCVIGGKKGLHLVLTDSSGAKTTLMMMPGSRLAASAEFSLPGISARVEPTPVGAMALFGHRGQDLDKLSRNILASLGPLAQTALLL